MMKKKHIGQSVSLQIHYLQSLHEGDSVSQLIPVCEMIARRDV